MAALAFCIILGAEIAKGHLEVLRSRVLFVGGRTTAADLIEALVENDRIPFTAVGIVDEGHGVYPPRRRMELPSSVPSATYNESCGRPLPILSSSPRTADDLKCSPLLAAWPGLASASSDSRSSTNMPSVEYRCGG